MKRILITTAATAICIALASSAAFAAVVELGTTPSQLVAPSCPKGVSPASCTIILTRVTAVETLRDGVAYPSTAKQSGRVVAFAVGLSRLSSSVTTAHKDIQLLDNAYGGSPRVAITVLRRVGSAGQRRWKAVAQSPFFQVQQYLGQVAQIPLQSTLPVLAGDLVALSTSTWAPVLSINLSSSRFAYRQGRDSKGNSCLSPPPANAALSLSQTATFGCNDPGTRVEYSATEITNPLPGNSIHSRDVRR